MKSQVVIIALIALLFVLVAGSILASVTFYKEYKEKIEYLDQQNQAAKGKVDSLDSKLETFKAAIDDISSQTKTYGDNIRTIQNTITLSDDERKSLLARIEEMKKDLQGMQKDYSSTVIDMRQTMMVLKDELDKMGSKTKDVELGKITVKQEEKPGTLKEMPKDKKQTSSSSAGSNFKSGNVKKTGLW